MAWHDTEPTIVFHFSESLRFTSVTLHADDANGAGGVFAPGGITVGGQAYTFADPAGSAPSAFTVDGLDLVGSALAITINRRNSDSWVFLSEVSFQATAVPEPGEWALVLASLSAVAAWRPSRAQRGNKLN